MRASQLRVVAAIAVLSALSACSLPRVVSDRSVSTNALAVRRINGPVAVVARGLPPGESSTAFVTKLVPALPDGAALGLGITYVPSESGAAGTAILLDFGGAGSPWTTVCAGVGAPEPQQPTPAGAAASAAPSGSLTLTGAICQAGGPINIVHGYVDGPLDPGNPAFQDLMRELVVILFRPRSPSGFGTRDGGT